jgi:hypothetical protein
MGVFKQMKEMKSMVTTAPDQLRNAMEMAANAKVIGEASAANAANFSATQVQPTSIAADLSPIAGVDIATYGWVTKQIAAVGYDQGQLVGFAATRGIDSAAWHEASIGWATRMTNATVATEFRRYYDAS